MKRDGWSRAVTVFGLMMLVSLGLCGLNFAVFTHYHLPIGGGSVPGQEARESWGGRLMVAGMLELLGIIVGGGGLVICLIGMTVSYLLHGSKPKDREES